VGANTRRIEAITSAAAVDHYRALEREWNDIAGSLEVRPERLPASVEKLTAQVADLQKKLKAAESGERRDLAGELLAGAVEIDGLAVVAAAPAVDTADELLALADELRAARPDSVLLLLADVDGRAAAVVTAGDAAVGRGLKAGDVLKAMLPAIGGKGGGKPVLARGGGPDVGGIPAALEAGLAAVRSLLDR
jgi:alanyl-tRNA synthetase